MEADSVQLNKRKDLILGGLTVLLLIYWSLNVWVIEDVYKYAVVGAIFELLWLPMILLLIGIPIISVVFWAKEKWSLKTAYLFSIIIPIVFLVVVITNS